MRIAAALVVLAAAGVAEADEPDPTSAQMVLVNAAPKLGDLGQIDRLRHVLDSRGLLHKLPDRIEAALDGRGVLVADVDAIKDAYMNMDYASAIKMINDDEDRVLKGIAAGDPVPALAELSQWRGMIAVVNHHDDEAISWFRAAYRFNPAWTLQAKFAASPTLRALVKKARREETAMGKLRVDAEPANAVIQIDSGPKLPASERQDLAVGVHLVTVSAAGHAPYAEMVEIAAARTFKLPIALEPETNDDRAARLIDATLAAAPGQARLKRAKALSHVTDVTRMLVIEDGTEDHVTVRLYDVEAKKISRPFDVQGSASSTEISRLVTAALDPENLLEPGRITVIQTVQPARWYEHWYVWAGVAAVLGASVGGYEYMTRSPTMVRF